MAAVSPFRTSGVRMRFRSRVQAAVPNVNVRMLVGFLLVAVAISGTFMANRHANPVMVDVLVAHTDVASGSAVGLTRQAFTTVSLPADSPLLDLLVTEAAFDAAYDAVFLRPVTAGEPLLFAALGERRPAGTVLTLLLARVAALDGDVTVGDQLRVLTSNSSAPNGFGVEVVSVRNVGGGLGRQEQVALTVRVDNATQAARLFGASTSDTLLLVRQAAP